MAMEQQKPSMDSRRSDRLLAAVSLMLAAAVVVILATPAATAQRGAAPRAPTLPPLSMTCPMHPDVVEARAGSCPLCRMSLVPVRLDTAWTCPIHSVVSESRAGACPICRRQLIQVTVALTWTCRGEPGIDRVEPGTCPDGSPTIARRTLRPHGNHNPQHGGQFFMAPDNWHHLEGAYPRDRVFRLYLYDDYARPLPPGQLAQVKARVVTRETYDPATRVTKELAAFPLKASRDGAYLEARVDRAPTPAEMTAKVRFKSDAPEYRFDFTFTGVTKDPSAVAPARAANARRPAASPPAPAPVAPAPASDPPAIPESPGPGGVLPTEPDTSLVAVPIPETLDEIMAQLKTRNEQVGMLISEGNFGAVYVPAFQARDLAIALEPQVAQLAPERRDLAGPAIVRLVRAAWLLDAYGDVGNRQQLDGAYSMFAATVSEITAAFAPGR
jgi:hypothetical protein